MARIRTYGLDSSIDPADKIIGTDGAVGPNQGDTKNFSVSSLVSYIGGQLDPVDGSGTANTIPIWTPDGNTLGDSVLTYDAPNTAITLTGKLVVTNTTNIQGNLTTEAGLTVNTTLADGSGSFGTSGQVLSSTGTATQWVDGIPSNNIVGSGTLDTIAMFTPDGQTIGDSGITKTNATTYQIVGTLVTTTSVETTVLTANTITGQDGGSVSLLGNVFLGNADTDTLTVTSTSTFSNNVTLGSDDNDDIVVEGTLELQGPVRDNAATLGTDGQILISDSSGQLLFGDQIDTTYTYSSAQNGSDVVVRLTDGVTNQDVNFVAGTDISLVDNGSNEITINATGGAANTTYDLVGTYNTNDTILTLQGSDATSDTFTLHAGSGISFGQDAVNRTTTIDLDITDNVTGSGTLNTIPIWTPDGQTLGDSSISFDSVTESVIVQGTSSASKELLVKGIDARIAIQSETAGDANIEFIPNATSNHAGVFELTDTDATRHFLWESNGVELMRLRGLNGNLGVGTTNPTFKVHVDGSSGFQASNNGVTYFKVFQASNSTFIDTGVNGGTIYIGAPTTSVTQNLHVGGAGSFRDGIKDTNNLVGTSGQVLSSTGSAVEWIDNTTLVAGTDISISQVGNEYTINSTATLLNTTYDLAGAIDGGNGKITLTGSDASEDIVTLEAGTNITLSSTQANTITIDTLDNIATRDTNGQHSNAIVPAFDNTTGTVLKNTGITINNGSVTLPGIASIGPISSNVLINGTITATNFIFGSGGDSISDFEEGTWTPDIKTYLTSTLNAVSGLAFDVQSGTYMKINDKVFCEFKLRYKLLPTYSWPANEYLVITGLPFTPEGGIRNSNLSGNINRLSSFNSTDADDLPRTLSNAQSPFYDVVIPTGLGLLPPQDTNSGTKPLLATLFSDQDDYTGGNYVEFYGSFTYTTT